MANSKSTGPIWNIIFIELALRAMRRLHREYGVWGTGQATAIDNKERIAKLNTGAGIELADERDVAAAINQEFINSPFTNGSVIDDQDRRYEILREVDFESKQENANDGMKKKYVDMVITRYSQKNGKIDYKYPSVLLELKRVPRFKPNTLTGEAEDSDLTVAINAVVEDLKRLNQINKRKKSSPSKLKSEAASHLITESGKKPFITCTFFWGTMEANQSETSLKKAINELKEEFDNTKAMEPLIRYMPLTWDGNDKQDKPKVTKWLWLCLYEADETKPTNKAKQKNKKRS